MRITVERVSTWGVGLVRDDGDAGWPEVAVLPDWAGHGGMQFRPHRLFAKITEGAGTYDLGVGGKLLKKDGSPGKINVGARWLPDDETWGWAHELVRSARMLRGLGPSLTGVQL